MLKIEAHGIRFNSISHLLEISPCCIVAENFLQNMFQASQLAPGKRVRSSKITGYFGREFLPCLICKMSHSSITGKNIMCKEFEILYGRHRSERILKFRTQSQHPKHGSYSPRKASSQDYFPFLLNDWLTVFFF